MTSRASSSDAMRRAAGPTLPRNTGCSVIRPTRVQLAPCRLREAEMRRVIAVDVPELAPADLERELTHLTVVDRDARPPADLVSDLLTEPSGLAHPSLLRSLLRAFVIGA